MAQKDSKANEIPEANFQRLYRNETNKVIAGVAGGLAEYFNIDPTIIRILFILLTIFGGSGIIIYIILWIVIPSKSQTSNITSETIKSNLEDIKTTTQTFAHKLQVQNKNQSDNSKFWWAILIIILGFMFLLNNYGLLQNLELDRLWPLFLIILGLAIILRK